MKISNVLVFLQIIFFTNLCNSQTVISGKITDNTENSLPYVSITINAFNNSAILAYTYSNNSGNYNIEFTTKNDVILTYSSLGYKTVKDTIIYNDLVNKILSKNMVLNEESISLNEVIINAEKAIKVKKDTVSFKAQKFTDGSEEIVEDLLKKIPGLSIDDNGTIKVGNREIEKLMIDGDDFFSRGYKLLSKNMPSHPIEEIEVLQNYSNNRLLKNIEESEKVAINLKLKEEMKRIWFGNMNASYALENFYHLKLNLMNFGKKNKYFIFSNLNNVGFDSTGDINDIIRPASTDDISIIGDNQSVNNLINLSFGGLQFNENRTNFNNSELASLNAIFNPSDKLKIQTLGFFNWDETDFFRNSTDIVQANGTNFTNTEDYELRNKKRIAFGKLDFIYNISKTKMLEATTKYNFGDFNDGSTLVFNGNSTIENLQHQNTLFDQKINYSNKYDDNKVFLLTGRFINEKAPQNYQINQFFYQDLFPESADVNNVTQLSENKMQFAGINAHLLNRKENGDLLELQLGNQYRNDELSSIFSLLEDEIILEQPNSYQNKTNYQVNDLYFKSKYRKKIKDFGLTGKLDLHQLFNQLQNNNSSSSQTPFFINPSVGIDWEINDNNKLISSYSYNTSNARTLDVYSDFILTGFRSFNQGTGGFNQLDSSTFLFNYQLGNWSKRFFANTFLVYKKNHDFFSTNTLINQNYTLSEKILIEDREYISLNSNLDYFIKFLSTNLKLKFGYSKSNFKNIINNSDLRNVKSLNYSYGIELRSGFSGKFNYHIGTKWKFTEIQTNIENSFTDNISFLDLSYNFNKKLNFQLKSERYYFGNLETDNTYYFLDFDLRYKVKKNKLTLGINGRNLLNTERFRNFNVSDIGTSTTEYRLLPRFVLLKAEYRF